MHSSYIVEADSAILRMGSTPMDQKFWWVVIVGYVPLFVYGYRLKSLIDRLGLWRSAMLVILAVCWLVLTANALYSPPFELRVLMSLLHIELGLTLFIAALFLRWLFDKSKHVYRQRRAS